MSAFIEPVVYFLRLHLESDLDDTVVTDSSQVEVEDSLNRQKPYFEVLSDIMNVVFLKNAAAAKM